MPQTSVDTIRITLLALLPAYVLSPFVFSPTVIVASHVAFFSALYLFLLQPHEEITDADQIPDPQFSAVYKFKRCDLKKQFVFDRLLHASIDTPTLLKLLIDNWRFINWGDFQVMKRIIIRLLISVVISFVSLADFLIYGKTLEKQKLNDRPVFVLGHFRSGTTLLHNLIVQNNEDFHYMNSLPMITPQGAVLLKGQVNNLSKALDQEHRWVDNVPFKFKDPQEDHIAIAQESGIGHCLCIVFAACYAKFNPWFAMDKQVCRKSQSLSADRENWKNSFLRIMKKITYIQDKEAKKRIVFKSPTHTAKVKILLEMFPNAQFVYIHRDPFRLFLSTAKLFETFVLTNDLTGVTDAQLQDFIISQTRILFKEYVAARDLIPEGNLFEISYDKLSENKVEAIKEIYSTLGWEGWDDVKHLYEKFAEDRKSYKKNEFVELSKDLKNVLREEWKEVFDYFKYETK